MPGPRSDLAKRWITAPLLQDSNAASGRLNQAIPDAPLIGGFKTVTRTLTLESDMGFAEFVEVTVDLDHSSFRDLDIELVSPSGAVSKLVENFDALSNGWELVPLDGEFRFGSARHLGEDPSGEWKLRVTDRIPIIGGTLRSWSIKVYGHSGTPTMPAPRRPVTPGDIQTSAATRSRTSPTLAWWRTAMRCWLRGPAGISCSTTAIRGSTGRRTPPSLEWDGILEDSLEGSPPR